MDGGEVDPIVTGAVVKVGAFGEKMADSAAKETGGLITRLFGPSADVIGNNWAERLRERNLDKLLRKTEKRAAGKADPGIANPRVASQVFEAAEYADAEVVSEYLSGVLASSRTPDGSSDRGVSWVALIRRLSSDELRLHYVIYASARQILLEQGFEQTGSAHNIEVVLPLRDLAASTQMTHRRIGESVEVLMREGLLGDAYRLGPRDFAFENELKRDNVEVVYPEVPALRVRVTVHGFALFAWGNGEGELSKGAYLDPTVEMGPIDSDGQLPLVETKLLKAVVRNKASES
ncbi:hypothetical protein MK786_01125 [Microbacterium sp. CFH 31415]|uniref:hypothetical protein n=1 Tax=Microbacterium sp. CFH 31415 TaxID=2921732 RepID=UPI001F146D1A|nr:hypothetical protein [Microbacterium sp. CFH 31415]MCH6229341.1 hypothetical protein [Microbacterium sp. CFH 31415]